MNDYRILLIQKYKENNILVFSFKSYCFLLIMFFLSLWGFDTLIFTPCLQLLSEGFNTLPWSLHLVSPLLISGPFLWEWSLMCFQKSNFCQKLQKNISQNYKFQEFRNLKAQFCLAPKAQFSLTHKVQFPWPPKLSFVWPPKSSSLGPQSLVLFGLQSPTFLAPKAQFCLASNPNSLGLQSLVLSGP